MPREAPVTIATLPSNGREEGGRGCSLSAMVETTVGVELVKKLQSVANGGRRRKRKVLKSGSLIHL